MEVPALQRGDQGRPVVLHQARVNAQFAGDGPGEIGLEADHAVGMLRIREYIGRAALGIRPP